MNILKNHTFVFYNIIEYHKLYYFFFIIINIYSAFVIISLLKTIISFNVYNIEKKYQYCKLQQSKAIIIIEKLNTKRLTEKLIQVI